MRTFSGLLAALCVLLGAAQSRADVAEPEAEARVAPRADDFVRAAADRGCDAVWRTWPEVHKRGADSGTVMVFDLVSRVGNAFMDLKSVIQVCRWLELGLVVDWKEFPGFREAFDTGEVAWDIDPAPFRRRVGEIYQGINATGLNEFRFVDGAMILSDHQATLLGSAIGIVGQNPQLLAAKIRRKLSSAKIRYWIGSLAQIAGAPTEPCTWNMLLKRSPSMMKSLDTYSPWRRAARATPGQPEIEKYVAWQIRTTDGESAISFKPHVHTYIFDASLPSTDVCPWYFTALAETDACPGGFGEGVSTMPIYISSNSKSMARNCSAEAAVRNVHAGFVDLGVLAGDAHTSFSTNPNKTAHNAFIDFFMLLDAAVVIRTGSSFSGMAVDLNDFVCSRAEVSAKLPVSGMLLCGPQKEPC